MGRVSVSHVRSLRVCAGASIGSVAIIALTA